MADEKDAAGSGGSKLEQIRVAQAVIDRAMLALTALSDGAISRVMMDVVKVYMPAVAERMTGHNLDLVPERIYAKVDSLTRQPDPPLSELRRRHEGAVMLAVETLVAFGMKREEAQDFFRLVPAMTEARREQLLDADEMRKLRIRRDAALIAERFWEAAYIDRELEKLFLDGLRRRDVR